MQKMTAVLLAFVLAFSLASCTGGEPTDRASVGANASTSAESVSAATESKETENDAGEQKVLVRRLLCFLRQRAKGGKARVSPIPDWQDVRLRLWRGSGLFESCRVV